MRLGGIRLFSFLSLIVYLGLVPFTESIPGNFMTFPILTNKRLPPANALANISGVSKSEDCLNFCIKSKECEAYAFNDFSQLCHLHELVLGTPSIKSTGYTLYVRARPEDEGYYTYGTNYIKLMIELMNFFDAQQKCKDMHGMLVAVRSAELNNLLKNRIVERNIWQAYIGLNDIETEMKWMYMDKGPIMYGNWNYKGVWERRDKNCATILFDGTWKQEICTALHYFFCQIPMY